MLRVVGRRVAVEAAVREFDYVTEEMTVQARGERKRKGIL